LFFQAVLHNPVKQVSSEEDKCKRTQTYFRREVSVSEPATPSEAVL